MKRNFEKLITKAGAQIRLSAHEHETMRGALLAYRTAHPLLSSQEPARTARGGFFAAAFLFSRRPAAFGSALVLLFALCGSGVAYAAENALPGDALYPVKVDITEPLRTVLMRTPKAQAAWQVQLATRRIDETAALANSGRLATTTATALAGEFEAHAAAAGGAINGERALNPVEADVTVADFNAKLGAYETVLQSVAAKSATSTTAAMRDAIRGAIESSSDASIAPKSAVPARAGEADVSHVANSASNAVRKSADIIGNAAGTLNASSTAAAETQLQNAEQLVEKGQESLRQHDTGGALHAFQDSLSATARLNVFTNAASSLNIPIPASPAADAADATSTSSDMNASQESRRTAHGSRTDGGTQLPSRLLGH